jgi:glycerophosphoryl diester phosphodiesterase
MKLAAERPLLLGHRGARRSAPENTLEAFDLCLAHGCDGFEFDLRLCADAQLVVCHDPRLAGIEIAAATYSALNERVQGDCGCRLPCLDDVLQRFCAAAFLNIELKVPGMEEAVVAAVRRHRPERGYVVSSFLPEVLNRIHILDSEVPLGLIFDAPRMLPRWRELPINYVIPNLRLLSAGLVQEAHDAGKKVMVWTVNQQREMTSLVELGVEGIISDDTELLCRTFRRARL